MQVLISLSFSLVGGLLMSRLAKKLNLPAVTAYLVAGLLLGPYCIGRLNLLGVGFHTPEEVSALDIISQTALGFIAFTIGNEFRLEDLRETALPAGSFDLAVCNPPYFPPSAGPLPKGEARRTARTEEACTLEDVCRAAGRLLRWGGAFCLVHKPERLTDLLCALRGEGLEPKRLRLVSLRPERAPSLLLLEARRGGKPGLAVEEPLILENPDGSPTAELNRIYFREEAPL